MTQAVDPTTQAKVTRERLLAVYAELSDRLNEVGRSGSLDGPGAHAWGESKDHLAAARRYLEVGVLPTAAARLAWAAAYLDVAEGRDPLRCAADARWEQVRQELPTSIRDGMPPRCWNAGPLGGGEGRRCEHGHSPAFRNTGERT